MRKIAQLRLKSKFPSLFRDMIGGGEPGLDNIGLPLQDNIQGCQCGDGWYNILYDLSTNLHDYALVMHLDLRYTQIKEKWSKLTIGINDCDEEINRMIADAQKEASITCEVCGSKERASVHGIVMKVLCSECEVNTVI